MSTIGIVGGMAWQSSAEVYKIINELVNKKLGGQHSCQCVMYSVDLDPVLIPVSYTHLHHRLDRRHAHLRQEGDVDGPPRESRRDIHRSCV